MIQCSKNFISKGNCSVKQIPLWSVFWDSASGSDVPCCCVCWWLRCSSRCLPPQHCSPTTFSCHPLGPVPAAALPPALLLLLFFLLALAICLGCVQLSVAAGAGKPALEESSWRSTTTNRHIFISQNSWSSLSTISRETWSVQYPGKQ